jgi:hypothetical protein
MIQGVVYTVFAKYGVGVIIPWTNASSVGLLKHGVASLPFWTTSPCDASVNITEYLHPMIALCQCNVVQSRVLRRATYASGVFRKLSSTMSANLGLRRLALHFPTVIAR